jgi:N-formylglutamate amidohydrolase
MAIVSQTRVDANSRNDTYFYLYHEELDYQLKKGQVFTMKVMKSMKSMKSMKEKTKAFIIFMFFMMNLFAPEPIFSGVPS